MDDDAFKLAKTYNMKKMMIKKNGSDV